MMKEKFLLKRFIIALLIGAAGALAGSFAPLLIVPAIAGIGFLGVCWGWSYGAIALALTLVGAGIANISNAVSLVSLLGAMLFSSLFLIAAMRKKRPYRLIAAVLAVICFACLYCTYCLPSVLAGSEPYKPLLDQFNAIAEALPEGYAAEELAYASEAVPNTFFGVLILISEAAAFAIVMLTKHFCKLGGADIRPMAKFCEWQLPHSLKYGLPVLAAGIAVLFIAKFGAAEPVFYTALYLLLPMFAAAGAGCLAYVGSKRPNGGGLFTAIAVVSAFLVPLFSGIIGVIDLYAGIRRKLIKTDKLIRAAFEKAEREKRDTVTVDFGDGRGPQVIAVRKKRIDDAFFDDEADDKEHNDIEDTHNNETKTEDGSGADHTADGSGSNNGGDDHEGNA